MGKTNYAGLDYSGPGSQVNRDSETGIRYGIIPSGRVSEWALDDIYTHGTDVDWENYICEVKHRIRGMLEDVWQMSSLQVDAAKDTIRSVLSDWLFHARLSVMVDEVYEEILGAGNDLKEVTERVFDCISEDVGMNYQGTGDCVRMEYEESDGTQVRIDGSGDLWVFKSPYFTYAQYCNPCAPGACYLTSPLETPVEANKCYCLGPDWFNEDNKCPYPIYSVETGKVCVPPSTT